MKVFATACDDYYADEALNLISSICQNSPIFDRLYVYDLGMHPHKRKLFSDIKAVEVRKVPPFTKYWRQCWSWKPWVWIDALKNADLLIYLDAGVEVLRSLTVVEQMVDESGYFVVSQHSTLNSGHTLAQIIPNDYYKKFSLPLQIKSKEVIAGGLVGIAKNSMFYQEVVLPCLNLTLQGHNLGWSKNELFRNKGINQMKNPPARDCDFFRHDQTLLNMLFYTKIDKPKIQPMILFGATTLDTSSDQVFWSSRKLGSLNYSYKVPYKSLARLKNDRNYCLIYLKHRLLKATPLFKRLIRKVKWILKDKRHATKS